MKPISVVIPTFNALDLLKEYFPKVVESFESYEGGGEIIVVDDGGNDGSPLWLKNNYPRIKIIELKTNMGFAVACNEGAKEAKNPVLVFLNNDMSPEGDFFSPLVKLLESNEKIFSVTAKSITASGGNESISLAEMDDGILLLRQPGLTSDTSYDIPVTLFHSAGGFSAYERGKFLELGGFDDIYHPFYWEDVDLSFRAWKKGWLSVYEPSAVVRHRSHGTIGRIYEKEKYDLIQHAHLHLFHMVNLESDELIAYTKRVNKLMSEINLYDKGVLRRGVFQALKKADKILERRKKISKGLPLGKILELSSNIPIEEVTI